MSGTRKVTFEKWVFRRKINVQRWARKHNVRTLNELKSWCEKYGVIAPTAPHILDIFPDKKEVRPAVTPEPAAPTDVGKPNVSNSKTRTKTASTKKAVTKTTVKKTKKKPPSKSRRQSKKADAEKKSWHVPAAERPVRRSSRSTKIVTGSSK